MKRLLATICVLLLLPIVVAVAGCNNQNEGNGWVEVQSITYTTENGTTTLTSECEWDCERVEIEKSEYDSAPQTQKWIGFYLYGTINSDRAEFILESNGKVGNTYYYTMNSPDADIQPWPYYKLIVKNYTLNYVKVKLVSDKVVEIDFNNEFKQVSTLTYEITYFKN